MSSSAYILSKIEDIEKEFARPIHTFRNKDKAAKHIGIQKAKLAKYRAELLQVEKKSSGGDSAAWSFEVAKTGDARVAFVGFPSVGKSSLMNILTDTKTAAVAAYEFTTLTCLPGMLQMNGAHIQLLDLPGIIRGASEGRGRGKQVIATTRTADLIIMVLDAAGHPNQVEHLTHELDAMGIRLNKKRPDVSFKIKTVGGVVFTSTCTLTHLDQDMVVSLLRGYKVRHAEIECREDVTVADLVDIIELSQNPFALVYIPCLYVYNKIDKISMEEISTLARTPHSVVISCELRLNMDRLLAAMWENLRLISVYTKLHGQPPGSVGLVVKKGATVEDLCRRIHHSLANDMKHALVWGTSVKYSPMRVGKEHVVEHDDVMEIVKKLV